MREQVVIPVDGEIRIVERNILKRGNDPMERQDFLDVDVAPMPIFGRGFKGHVTSSCHDKHGMRNLNDPEVMHQFVSAPIEKIFKHRDDIVQVEAEYSGAEIALVSYGTVSRSARAAVQLAKAEGLRVGTLRLITCWPLPGAEIRQMAELVDLVIVLENNTGQLYPYVKAESVSSCRVEFLGPEILGQIHDPEFILSHMKEIIK